MPAQARQPSPEPARRPKATTEEVAAYLRIPKHTLECWRSQGKGPSWRKTGRVVTYDLDDVEEWWRQQPGGSRDTGKGAA